MAESDPLVEVRDAGEGKGFGAFARVSIPAGVELGIYQGERLTYAQLEKRYFIVVSSFHQGQLTHYFHTNPGEISQLI